MRNFFTKLIYFKTNHPVNSAKVLGQFDVVLFKVLVESGEKLWDMVCFHVFEVADGGLLEANHVFG